MKLAARAEKARDALWNADTGGLSRAARWSAAVLRLLAAVGRDLREGDLRLRATSLVYVTLLSLAPLLALSFSVLKGLGAHNQMEPFLRGLLEPLGAEGPEVAGRIVGFVGNVQVGVLGAVGLAVLVFSVIGMMHAIERAFNDIWRVQKPRRFPARVRDYLGLLFVGPMLMFVSVALTAMLRHMPAPERLSGAAEGAALLLAWLLFAAAFAALYMLMPNTRVRPGPALLAGLMTGALWKAMGWLFGVFVAGSGNYEAVYSAFAALILFMIWLYVGWLVVLAGASACYYMQNPSNQRLSRRGREASTRVREKVALAACAAVGAALYARRPPPDLAALARGMSAPVLIVEGVARDLVQGGILAVAAGGGYVPACPFDETPAAAVLDCLRAAGEETGFPARSVAVSPAVAAALESGGASFTLKQLGKA